MTWLRPPGAVAAFCLAAFAAPRLDASMVKLEWNPNPEPDISVYRVHYGTRPGNHEAIVETNENTVTLSGLVEGQIYYFTVQAVNASGFSSVPSDEFFYQIPSPPEDVASGTVFPGDLPLPWSHMDLGAVNPDATASVASGVFRIQGSGILGGGEDTARFVWQPLSGNGEISARIAVLENAPDSSRIGVMIRDSLAANSKHVFFGVDGGGRYQWVSRGTPGGQPYFATRAGGGLTNLWIRLKRSADKITAYSSVNGRNWKALWKGTRKNLTLGNTCYIGFSVSSGSDAPCSAIFSDVKVTP